MAHKNQEALYVRVILDKLKLNNPDFDKLCNDVLEIQRLTKSRNKGHRHIKEVILSWLIVMVLQGKMLQLQKST